MIKHLFTLIIMIGSLSGIMATGHSPTSSIGYHDGNHNHPYTVDPNGRQSSLHLDMAHSDIPANAQADIYPLFTFDTSGKNVYLVYTQDGTTPTKSNGSVISCSFSKYNDPDRWWKVSIPAINTVGTTVKYLIYISDSSLANAWGRIGINGYVNSWTEGDDAGFSFVTQAVLPVTLSGFSGKVKNGKNLINWNTASEINNDRFEIEHSTDTRVWEKIGSIPGNGSSMITHNYAFWHNNPTKGQNYYRLKQIDFDGQYEYSPSISLINHQRGITIDVFPNPSKDYLNIKGDDEMIGMQLILTDITGKEIMRRNIMDTRIEIPVATFRSGWYLVQVVDGNAQQLSAKLFEKI